MKAMNLKSKNAGRKLTLAKTNGEQHSISYILSALESAAIIAGNEVHERWIGTGNADRNDAVKEIQNSTESVYKIARRIISRDYE